jgi:hypothetical protein
MQDIKLMASKRMCEYYLFVTWCFLTPLLILLILVLMSISYETPIVNHKPLPNWAVNIGWSILTTILLPIPAVFVYELYKAFKKRHLLRVSIFGMFFSKSVVGIFYGFYMLPSVMICQCTSHC